jgi:cell division FtsZ-interacting protein ZapD
MILESNLHIWKHHLNAAHWKQIEQWKSGETVTDSAMANVLNGWKISFVVNFSGSLDEKFSYTGTYQKAMCMLIKWENYGTFYPDVFERKTS